MRITNQQECHPFIRKKKKTRVPSKLMKFVFIDGGLGCRLVSLSGVFSCSNCKYK